MTQTQKNFLLCLEIAEGITDVYFHKDTLYVVNDYDVASVVDTVTALNAEILVRAISSDEMAY